MDSDVVSSSDWAALPKQLLDSTLEKLNLFSDYIRFSAVCVLWYSVALENRKQFAKKIDRQLPMLLLPKKDEEEVKSLYNVSTKRFIDVELRLPYSTRFGGSSKGWLIIMSEDFVVTLINPFSPEAAITLPPIRTDEVDYPNNIQKAILSSDPMVEPDDYTVAIIYGDRCQLAFIKPGRHDTCWTFINEIWTAYEDIIYHKGRLHAVDYVNVAYSFDNGIIMSSSVPRRLPSIPDELYTIGNAKSYLVESLAGELLLVRRVISFDEVRDTTNIDVFKWNPSGPIWVKLESLGDESLFLGDNMSTSVRASEFQGCSPNSIYFTHDWDVIFGYGNDGPRDSGVYDLENSSIAPYYTTDRISLIAMSRQPPIWFVPNFLSKNPFPISIRDYNR